MNREATSSVEIKYTLNEKRHDTHKHILHYHYLLNYCPKNNEKKIKKEIKTELNILPWIIGNWH